MSKSAIYLITGYLGSGKTTFIKNLINTYTGTEKLAVIQNEFAPANVDGLELNRTTNKHFEMLEVNNGSVFCVCLLSGFVKSLKAFITQHKPGIILMEASGLSDPVSIGQIFSSPDLMDEVFLGGVMCIIDAMNYIKMNSMMQQIGHQVMIADQILINKTDLPCNLTEIETAINKVNPKAQKHYTVQGNIPYKSIFQISGQSEQQTPKKFFYLQNDTNRPDIQSVVLKTAGKMKADKLDGFLTKLSKSCYRVKGFIVLDNGDLVSVQLVASESGYELIDGNNQQTEIIAIGKGITPKFLKALYDEACRAD